MRRGRRTMVVVCLLIAGLATGIVNMVSEEASAYTLRGTIRILSDSEFTPANGVTGGSGTPADPYMIEGWEIECWANCISITQTTVYFTIRDSYLHSGWSSFGSGILLNQVENGRVENVSVYETNAAVGLSGSNNNHIYNNNLDQNRYGVKLSGDSNIIENNTITSNGRGVLIQHSTNGKIIGNNITDSGNGVEIVYADTQYNEISYNNIAFNSYAFYITDGSNNNTIHHNNISDTWWDHVWDETYANNWDNGYPSGGNCWDDYVAWDQYIGPDQDQPGSDGIGDMFYIVESVFTIPGLSNIDEYPLMCLPWGGWDGTGYVHRDPILMDLQDGLKNNIGITGGRGTPTNPFLVEGWEIGAGFEEGIMIANSDVPITIRNVYVHDGGSSYSGIRLYSAWPVRMENVIATRNYYGIRLDGAVVEIVNCNITLNTNHGIWAPTGGGIIADNDITSNGGRALDLNWRGSVLRNNISSNGGGINLDFARNIEIAHNNISGMSVGINIERADDAVITENNMSSNGWGLYLGSSLSNVSIVGNEFYNNSVGIADWSQVDDISISNNNFQSNVEGIWAFGAGNHVLDNNTFLRNSRGVSIDDSINLSITHNEFSDNGYGIYSLRAQENTISSNYLGNNTFGMHFYGSQWSPNENNTIANNTFADNVGVGIEFRNENYNNTVYHNNFVNNGIQAIDEWFANQWDNGYPSGGNYWSNYTGPDNCSGPNQDICPDPDGIGDIQFIIDADSQDRYPLIAPLGMVVPRPPTGLGSELSGASLQDVTLTWALSADDGKGLRTVKEYRIFRNTSFDPDGMGYALYATLPNGTSLFVDTSVGEGDPDNYFYQLCGADLGNNTTCAKTQVAKFTRPLSQGFNIVSVPLIQSDGSIETAFQTVTFERAWSFDSHTGEWKSHMKFKPYSGDLGTIERTLGIWIDIVSDSNLTVAGVVPLGTSIQLKAGLNLIGFPSLYSSITVGDLKAATGATRVEGLDPFNPPFFTKPLPDTEILQSGYGYWVMVEIDATWTVSNS